MIRNGYLSPYVIQGLGVLLLVVFVVVWITAGQESTLLVGAALALIGVGSASGALITVRQDIRKAQDDEESTSHDRRTRDKRPTHDGQ